ncbi:TetR/AcrR family transcriptional regulator [Nocardia fluminea]|uniref:TetR/AcrR family transcriptional regulator n=1 Tax=Nocardia fluminea TaxID=134984 RepID=UPI0033EB8670
MQRPSPPSSSAAELPRPRAATHDSLLDAAEELFAEMGYHGASVRDITSRAGTRLAAVNDAFGGKENLFREVLLRRARPLAAARLAKLAAIDHQASPTDRVRHIVESFAEPMLGNALGDRGWTCYFRIVAQLAHSAQPIQLIVAEEYNKLAEHFVSALGAVFPNTDSARRYDAYLFMLSLSLDVFSVDMRLDYLSGHTQHSNDLHRRYTHLMEFAVPGITRLLDIEPAGTAPEG